MIGDMVGDRGNMRPAYDSAMILEEVQKVFPELDNTNVSIVWADHDMNVNDEGTDIVKCMGGTGSEEIFEGKNGDSSPAYYIYAIAHYEMSRGDGASTEAAGKFKTWVDGINHTIPVIVVCHVPIQASRGDNRGASYWNEALNYAATGKQGITTTEQTADIIRNVLFLHGHNHTNDPDEHYFGAGTEMNVQVDTSSEQEAGAEQGPGGRPPFHPGRKAEGVLSNIYYTSLTAGYLKTTGNATLVTIKDGALTLTKYKDGQNVSLGMQGETKKPAVSSITIPAQRHIDGDGVEENITQATCENSGVYDLVVYCTVCGDELYRTRVTTNAAGHQWGRWTVVREATETAEREERRSCTVCGKTEQRPISQLRPENPDKPEAPEQHEQHEQPETPEQSDDPEETKTPAEPAPEQTTPEVSPSASTAKTEQTTPEVPQTGDSDSALIWIILMSGSAAALWVLCRKRSAAAPCRWR